LLKGHGSPSSFLTSATRLQGFKTAGSIFHVRKLRGVTPGSELLERDQNSSGDFGPSKQGKAQKH
jgi:hypothetical protein